MSQEMQDIYIGGNEPKRIPNPNGIRPLLDTEPPPATRMPKGVLLRPVPTAMAPKMDMSNPAKAQIIPGLSGVRRNAKIELTEN